MLCSGSGEHVVLGRDSPVVQPPVPGLQWRAAWRSFHPSRRRAAGALRGAEWVPGAGLKR